MKSLLTSIQYLLLWVPCCFTNKGETLAVMTLCKLPIFPNTAAFSNLMWSLPELRILWYPLDLQEKSEIEDNVTTLPFPSGIAEDAELVLVCKSRCCCSVSFRSKAISCCSPQFNSFGEHPPQFYQHLDDKIQVNWIHDEGLKLCVNELTWAHVLECTLRHLWPVACCNVQMPITRRW